MAGLADSPRYESPSSMPERLSGIEAENEWRKEMDSVKEETSTEDSAKAYCGQRDSHME